MAEGKIVSIYEGKTHFSELVALAEGGEEITVTRHGRPVARIVRADPPPKRVFGLWKDLLEVVSMEELEAALDAPWTAEEIAEWEDGPIFPTEEDLEAYWAAHPEDREEWEKENGEIPR